jgi:ABC-2 type transport system ATP-binding protein
MARAFSVDAWEPKAEELMRMFSMTEKRGEFCVKLSKGMKQKVMLMSAFIHDPTVLLMDEPLYGIDPRGSYALKNLVRERIAAGASIVISSHTLSLIEEVCARVAIMSHAQAGREGRGCQPRGSVRQDNRGMSWTRGRSTCCTGCGSACS